MQARRRSAPTWRSQAIARTLANDSAKNASRSFASASLVHREDGVEPLDDDRLRRPEQQDLSLRIFSSEFAASDVRAKCISRRSERLGASIEGRSRTSGAVMNYQHRHRLFDIALERRQQFGARARHRPRDGRTTASPSSRWRKPTPPSSFSTACRRAAPTARIVACGGLMMAENSRTPYMPRLEIADEPP